MSGAKIALLTVLILISLVVVVALAPRVLGFGYGTLIVVLAVFWLLSYATDQYRKSRDS